MKKFSIFLATLVVLMACVMVSCGDGGSGDGDDKVTAKYLTEDEFVGSSWKGQKSGKEITLDVTSKTSMTLKYYITISKNTDPEYKQVTVDIAYSFDAAKGVATGFANNVSYVATLTAKDKLNFTMGSDVVSLSKK